ncbi:MAG: YceI family protein [Planctomycetes bacterium]|nr:YceI family protein [Planctomycetota bacterium]
MKTPACIFAWCLAAAVTAAEPATYVVDPAASTVSFTGHSTFHDFTGTAQVKAGTVTIDGEHSQGAIEVDAASMDTKREGRDKDMHKDMDSATYPIIRYTLSSVTGSGEAMVAHGTWSMHGVDKLLDIPFKMETAGKTTLSASFPLNFNDFKVVVPRNFGMKVDPKVDVRVELALTPSPAKP